MCSALRRTVAPLQHRRLCPSYFTFLPLGQVLVTAQHLIEVPASLGAVPSISYHSHILQMSLPRTGALALRANRFAPSAMRAARPGVLQARNASNFSNDPSVTDPGMVYPGTRTIIAATVD